MACADSAFVPRDRSPKSAPMLVLFLTLASLAGFDMTSASTALALQFMTRPAGRREQGALAIALTAVRVVMLVALVLLTLDRLARGA